MPPHTIQTDEKRKVSNIKYLTAQDVSRLLDAAKETRYPDRDRALILLTFRHGLRASEAVDLQWSQIHLESARIDVVRRKGSDNSVQALESDELRLLKRLKKNSPDNAYVFLSERGTPMTSDNFLRLLNRLGEAAGFSESIHPHQLRHGAGYQLINGGASTRQVQLFLGHKNLKHTELYTKLNANEFIGFGRTIGGKL
ncbi:MAG TPA: DUF3435 domain-containing protein [Oculatellaceae cyanobacterium]